MNPQEQRAACTRLADRIERALRERNGLTRNVSVQESAVTDIEGQIRAAEIELRNLDASIIPSHPRLRNPGAELLGLAAEIAKERRKGQISDRIARLKSDLRNARINLNEARRKYEEGEADLRSTNAQYNRLSCEDVVPRSTILP